MARIADNLDDIVGQLQRIADAFERLVNIAERTEAAITAPARTARALIYRHIL